MESTHYIRVLRHRWKLLALCALAGLLLSLASTFVVGREKADPVTHWVATHKLIVNDEGRSGVATPNLLQTSLFVTGGDVPGAVAAARGEDEGELTARVRTVTDLEVSVIELSAVGTDPVETAALVDQFAAELQVFLGASELADHEAALTAGTADVERLRSDVEAVESDIRTLEGRIGRLTNGSLGLPIPADEANPEASAPVELGPAEEAELATQRDALRLLETERDALETALADAQDALARLERLGPPAPLLQTLDVVPPFTISAAEYDRRIAQGLRGENSYSKRTLDSSSSSSGGLGLADTVANPAVRVLLGGIIGLLLGVAALFVHLRFDPRLRTKTEVEEAFDLPVIAEIPRFDRRKVPDFELHSLTRTRSAVTEAYRMVRSALLFARTTSDTTDAWSTAEETVSVEELESIVDGVTPDDDVRVVMVTSPGPSEGKTTTTANLAVVLAEAGYEVLVVNCDYRLPKLHRYFHQPHETRRTLDTGIPGVTLIADVTEAGDRNPTTVVEAQRSLIERARERYDVVLLDTAPLLATNDAVSLLPVVDMVVLVAQEGRTDREAAEETISVLRRRQAPVAGVVLTASSGIGRSRYYQKYRYGNYYDAVPSPRVEAEADLATDRGSRKKNGRGSRNKKKDEPIFN